MTIQQYNPNSIIFDDNGNDSDADTMEHLWAHAVNVRGEWECLCCLDSVGLYRTAPACLLFSF